MRRTCDKPFLTATLVLVIFGFFALASASLGLMAKEGISMYQYLSRQLLLGLGLGGFLFFLGFAVPYRFWRKAALPVFLASIALMLLVYEPHIGFEHGGARRWLNFGYFFFQPSEFLKFGFLIYLSSWIASRKEDVASFKFGFMPFLVIVGFVAILLIMQPDVGTFGVIALSAAILFYLGGGKMSQLGALFLLGLILLAILVAMEPYRLERINVFLNPESDLQGAGYQLHQSRIAIGSGGIFGRGFGKSIQKFDYLPEATGDAIFAVIAEELGFVGSFLLVFVYLFFLWRGLFISKTAPDLFGGLLAAGFVILIVVQSFVNIGALSGILPLTGLPLVFISKGGSSLAISLLMVGVILNISKYAKL